jgi:hypothetical protein
MSGFQRHESRLFRGGRQSGPGELPRLRLLWHPSPIRQLLALAITLALQLACIPVQTAPPSNPSSMISSSTPCTSAHSRSTVSTHRSPRRSDLRGRTIGGSGSRAGTGTEVIPRHRRAFYRSLAIARAPATKGTIHQRVRGASLERLIFPR